MWCIQATGDDIEGDSSVQSWDGGGDGWDSGDEEDLIDELHPPTTVLYTPPQLRPEAGALQPEGKEPAVLKGGDDEGCQ